MKLILNGALGRMGRAVAALAADRGHEIVAGVDIVAGDAAFPVYTDWANLPAADAVIDFSNPSALEAELRYVTAHNLPLVLCTTGLSADQLAAIAQGLNLIYRLTADIVLPNSWMPLGTKDKPFTGYLDGNGYTITLCTFENTSIAGLFGYNDGVIVNLNITGINVLAGNKDTVFGGIAAYNTGVISNCVASGDAFVTLTVTTVGASEGLKRTVHSGVFGCLVGVNQPSGRILGSTVSCALLAKIDNTAKSTATNSLIGWLTRSFDSIRVESVANLTVGIVAGQNNGTVGACRATGLTNIGEWKGIGKPVAIAAYRYGTVTAENHYYCDGITGINGGTVYDSDVPFLQFNVPPETEHNVNSHITYKERTMCCIYTAEF